MLKHSCNWHAFVSSQAVRLSSVVGRLKQMKIFLLISFNIVFFYSRAFSTEQSDLPDAIVLNTVLESVLNEVIKNWQILDPAKHCMILSDRSIIAQFPQSKAQVELMQQVTEQDNKNRNIDWEPILFGDPEKHKDYVMPDDHIIPADVVDSVLSRSNKHRLPFVAPKSALRLFSAKASFLDRTFRNAKTSEFVNVYPCAFGLIEISLPGYSHDGNLAGVSYSTLATRIGGGGSFVLLKRIAGKWDLQWTHTAWIE
jgi:hypothetical protein